MAPSTGTARTPSPRFRRGLQRPCGSPRVPHTPTRLLGRDPGPRKSEGLATALTLKACSVRVLGRARARAHLQALENDSGWRVCSCSEPPNPRWGDRAESNRAEPEPSHSASPRRRPAQLASAEAIHDFGDVMPGGGKGGGATRVQPRLRPYKTPSRALCGAASSERAGSRAVFARRTPRSPGFPRI